MNNKIFIDSLLSRFSLFVILYIIMEIQNNEAEYLFVQWVGHFTQGVFIDKGIKHFIHVLQQIQRYLVSRTLCFQNAINSLDALLF